jgi:hypothetical protein
LTENKPRRSSSSTYYGRSDSEREPRRQVTVGGGPAAAAPLFECRDAFWHPEVTLYVRVTVFKFKFGSPGRVAPPPFRRQARVRVTLHVV